MLNSFPSPRSLVSPVYWSAVLCASHTFAAVLRQRDSNCTYPALIDATSDDLSAGLADGCFTSVDLVNAYIARIQEVNDTVRAVTQLNPQALFIAAELDAERENGTLRSPLHGLPVIIKGNIGTADEMATSAGSYALVGAKPVEDAFVAGKLREAGLIILGKSGLSQWANFRSDNSSNGWSAYGGQVTGAYYPEQDPSGSSSGSGVSSDLGLAFAALGTETSGSIVSPSELNNIVGIKPTVGLTSRSIVVPISERQDTVGPMARTVTDAAKLLSIIAGRDPLDNYTLASPYPYTTDIPDYVNATSDLFGVEGKRIGIATNVLDYWAPYLEPEVITAFKTAALTLTYLGATIIHNANFTAYESYLNSSVPISILNADFISDLHKYLTEDLATNPLNLTTLAEVRTFTHNFPLEDWPDRDTGVWDAALAENLTNTDPAFWPLYQQNLYFGDEGGILGALRRDNLDAIILPTAIASDVPALVGSPLLTVPLGSMSPNTTVTYNSRGDLVETAPGIPFGISFLGDKWSEYDLIRIAYAFEQQTLVRGQVEAGHYIVPTVEIGDVVG